MYLVAIAWLYVALMMAVAEATNTNGTVLGAVFTFVLYGALPTALVLYLMNKGLRLIKPPAPTSTEAAAHQAPESASGTEPDARGQTPADPVAPVRKEP